MQPRHKPTREEKYAAAWVNDAVGRNQITAIANTTGSTTVSAYT